LESVIGGFTVRYRKPLDIFFKAAYTPVIPLYGILKEDFPEFIYTAGFTAAVELISSFRTAINVGIEISYSAYILNNYVTLNSSLDDAWYGIFNNNGMAFNDFDINVSLQKRFNKRRMAVTLRLGCGFSLTDDYSKYDASLLYEDSVNISDFSAHLNFGLSYMLLIYDIFYLDFGAVFNHHITGGSSGIIRPKLALVWKF